MTEVTHSTQVSTAARTRTRRNVYKTFGWILLYTGLMIMAISMLIPFVWMVFTSFKPQTEIFKMPPVIFTTHYTIAHYVKALTRGNFNIYFKNSLIVSLSITVITVFITSLAGYAFARLQWRGRNLVFLIVLAVMMLPGLIALIPTFLIVKSTPFAGGNNWMGVGGTGWLDSYPGLIVPSVGGGFYVFLLRQFFLTLPKELEDAGRIDGCDEFRIFWTIMLPLCKPVLAVVALFSFQSAWNDFLWPLVIVQSDSMRTVQIGLTLFKTQHTIDWGVLMAGTAIASVPTIALFLAFQRYFVQGIALTGIKG
jgi:multiple sugar transport system permease protein